MGKIRPLCPPHRHSFLQHFSSLSPRRVCATLHQTRKKSWPGFESYVIARLPQLERLDGKEITRTDRIKAQQRLPALREEIVPLAEEVRASMLCSLRPSRCLLCLPSSSPSPFPVFFVPFALSVRLLRRGSVVCLVVLSVNPPHKVLWLLFTLIPLPRLLFSNLCFSRSPYPSSFSLSLSAHFFSPPLPLFRLPSFRTFSAKSNTRTKMPPNDPVQSR